MGKIRVRILTDVGDLSKGEVKDLPHAVGKDLIAKGFAVMIRETGEDKNASNALQDAKNRGIE